LRGNFGFDFDNDADDSDRKPRGHEFGWSAAHEACDKGDVAELRRFCKGAGLSVRCAAGNSLLHVAARSGQVEVVRFLLSQKQVNMNGRNKNGWTPLIWAAITGSEEVATLLIQAGCDIFVQDEKGMTALMWAAKHGHEEVAKMLLTAGEQTVRKDDKGWQASDHAKNHAAMLALLETSARLNQKLILGAQQNDSDVVAQCLKEGAQANHTNDEGWSALLWAAVHGSVSLMQLLFKYGASTQVLQDCAWKVDNTQHSNWQVSEVLRTADGANARLLLSAARADWHGVRQALKHCAFVNARDPASHRTAISWAASYGRVDVVQTLAQQKAEVLSLDEAGWTALHFAVSGGFVEVVSLLQHAKGALGAKTFEGDSLLQMAVQADDASMSQLLLASSPEASADATEAAAAAAQRGCAKALHALLMYKADPQASDDAGNSLLHLAAMKGHGSVIRLLVKPYPPLERLRHESLLESRMKGFDYEDADAASVISETPSADAASDGGASTSSKSSRSLQGRLPSKSVKPKPKATRKSMKRPTAIVQKVKAGKGSQVSPEEAVAFGHLVMLLKARKTRAVVNSAPPSPLPVRALNEAHPTTGLTPLAAAISHGHVNLVLPLVNLKADANALGPKGDTPLMMAAMSGDVAAIAALIEAGASLTQKNKDGRQALDLASTIPARAALMTSTVRKIAGLPRPLSASLAPIRKRRTSAAVHHRFRLEDLPGTLGTADLLEGHIRALLRRVGAPRPDVLDIPVDPIRQKAKGIAYLEYADAAAADKAEVMFTEAQDQKGPMGTMARLYREGTTVARRPSTPGLRSGH